MSKSQNPIAFSHAGSASTTLQNTVSTLPKWKIAERSNDNDTAVVPEIYDSLDAVPGRLERAQRARAIILLVGLVFLAGSAISVVRFGSPLKLWRRESEYPGADVMDHDGVLHCYVAVVHEMLANGQSSDSFSCRRIVDTKDGSDEIFDEIYYHLDLPTSPSVTGEADGLERLRARLAEKFTEYSNIKSDVVELLIPGGRIDAQTSSVLIPDPDRAEVIGTTIADSNGDDHPQHKRHRRMLSTVGTVRTLVVRIQTPDAACTYSGDALWSLMFSGDGSVTTQLQACSNYQLTLTPASYQTIDVYLPTINAYYSDRMALVNAAYPIATEQIKATDPSYGWIASLEDYADLLLFMVVSTHRCSELA
jgi:hypothetical protein